MLSRALADALPMSSCMDCHVHVLSPESVVTAVSVSTACELGVKGSQSMHKALLVRAFPAALSAWCVHDIMFHSGSPVESPTTVHSEP